MSLLKEFTDGLTMVAEAITNIKDIHTAIKDGKKYFEKAHPEIKNDVAAMCKELQNTCNAIATASSVITNFKFNSSAGVIDSEPTRFNDYFVSFKTDKNKAEDLIRSLKGHCHIIRDHVNKIRSKENKPFWSYIGLYSSEREQMLAQMLDKIYYDESDFQGMVQKMAGMMNIAIDDVTNELSENGMLNASKVPPAAARLNEYSQAFKKLETLAQKTRDALDNTIEELKV